MGKAAWSETRGSKFFYVQLYRKTLLVLWVSLSMNILFALGVYYFYFKRPAVEFYASNGVTQPVKLTARATPNPARESLLPSEPPADELAAVTIT